MRLNNAQMSALDAQNHIFIDAAPGSGKTTLVAAKVVHEVQNALAHNRQILCLTFTNAAREEIDQRVDVALSPTERRVVALSTVNSFCLNEIIRPVSTFMKYGTNLRLATPGMPAYRKAAREALRPYLKPWDDEERRTDDLESLLDRLWRDEKGTPRGERFESSQDAALKLALPAFWVNLRNNGLIDHSSVLYIARRALNNSGLCKMIASRYSWIIIDEYQDSNEVQIGIFEALFNTDRAKFFVIGDLNQTIYGFNGVSIDRLRSFAKRLPRSAALIESHRLPLTLCRVADRMFARDMKPSGIASERSGLLLHIIESSETALSDSFFPWCNRLKILPENTAILSSRGQRLDEIADFLRLLEYRVVVKQSRNDREWLANLVEAMVIAALKPTASRLRKGVQAIESLIDYFNIRSGIPDAIHLLRYPALTGLISLKSKLRMEIDVATQIDIILFHAFNAMTAAGTFSDSTIADLQRRCSIEWKHRYSQHRFQTETISQLIDRLEDEKSISAMTIHHSKGLQFDAVALLDFDEGSIPFLSSPSPSSLDEDLRKLYVALTRSRRFVLIQSSPGKKSRFSRLILQRPQ